MNWYKISSKEPYQQKIQKIGKFCVWTVDGDYIRKNIDLQFNNFGEHNKFKFIPENEFWIDKIYTESKEIPFFIVNMLRFTKEIKDGKEFSEAVDIAGKEETKERNKSKMSTKIRDNKQELKKEIYIKLLKDLKDIKIWLVDGKVIRDILYVDFTAGGHDKVYDFVPKNEIWIDNATEAEEVPIVLVHEMHERHLMSQGMGYDKAHNRASSLESECRESNEKLRQSLKNEFDRYLPL